MTWDDPDGFDWASLLLSARLDLGMSEAEFWRCLPRKYQALANAAIERNRARRRR